MALSTYCSSFGQQDFLAQPDDDLLYLTDNFNYPFLEFEDDFLPLCSSPKRQRICFEDYSSGALQIPAQPPKFEAPTAGFCGNIKKRSGSAQSIAARERRRKITEKTHELGKLIPGGNKMNTAQMLRSAFNYVKFLQAQVQLLQLMHQFDDKGSQFYSDELQFLVASPRIQEKLYSEEKCLVPVEFLRSIANHDEIQDNEEIHLLLGNNC